MFNHTVLKRSVIISVALGAAACPAAATARAIEPVDYGVQRPAAQSVRRTTSAGTTPESARQRRLCCSASAAPPRAGCDADRRSERPSAKAKTGPKRLPREARPASGGPSAEVLSCG
jgi:hypothetical protein